MGDVQAFWDVVCRVVVTRHGGHGRPTEVVVQNLTEPFVTIQTDVDERQIEASYRPTIHFFMWAIPAVHPHHRSLVSNELGVPRWATQRLYPVRSKAFGVLGVVAMAERVAHHFVGQHPGVPGMRQLQESLVAPRLVVDRLHESSMACHNPPDGGVTNATVSLKFLGDASGILAQCEQS